MKVPRLAAAQDHPIDQQNKERTDDCGDKTRGFAFVVPANRLPEETCKQCTRNAEQYGDQATARVLPRHQKLGNAAGEQADYDPAEDPVIFDHPYCLPVVKRRLETLDHARFSFATTRFGVTGAAVRRKSLFTGCAASAV